MQAPQSSTNAVARVDQPTAGRKNEATVTIPSDPNDECARVFADAVNLRHATRRLIQQSRTLSDQSRTLKQWWRAYRQNRTQPPRKTVVAQSSASTVRSPQRLATARRVPWRRLQMEDMDGSVVEWTAPEYTEVFP